MKLKAIEKELGHGFTGQLTMIKFQGSDQFGRIVTVKIEDDGILKDSFAHNMGMNDEIEITISQNILQKKVIIQ